AGPEHVVVDFQVREEEGGGWEEGEGWLSRLVPLRGDILAGDLRALYLGWLAGVGFLDPDEDPDLLEPPVPPGLDRLSGPLQALAEFLGIEDDLREAAVQASAGEAPAGPGRRELSAWLGKLPAARKDDWLLRLAEDETPRTRLELLKSFREEWA